MNSTDHTTPVVAVKAVGLVGTHKRVARFIVFAPANEAFAAFAALPPATVDSLIKPENKPMLTCILPCHKVQLKTVNSETLTSPDDHTTSCYWTRRGHTADISAYDVIQSNGVVVMVDKMPMPK
ncbi:MULTISPECIES: fasciclin domain-containing protein [Paraburkholderia]|uniref:fasciclin domain-containing protein n=1 Tax=Paraburkholderia TaxID=1822464 RepID=UPI001FE8507E|nr:fasciclin domain-containing protein [Paraburkholderia podalyriae]